MRDNKLIISTFERIEEQDGELWNYNASTTIDKTAEELKLPRDEIKDILVSHWTNQGAG